MLRKKEFRISKPYEKSSSVSHSSKPSITEANYGLSILNESKSKERINNYSSSQ